MLQARLLLCLSLAASQVWAQGAGSGSQSGASTDAFQCYQKNPWWTYLNDTSGDACHVALQMRKTSGLGSTPSGDPTLILKHPESTQLCLLDVYDVYGACLTCMEASPPANHMMPSWKDWCGQTQGPADLVTSRAIEQLAPSWTKKVNFTDGTWDVTTVQIATGALPSTSQTPPSATASSVVGDTQSTAPPNTSSHKSSNVGPIVGGVIGGLALISIGAAFFFLYLRRQKSRRVAPSSEFTRYIQPGGVTSTRPETALSGSRGTIPRQDSATIPLTAGEDEALDAPPAFTPGQYTGPVFEKDGYRSEPSGPLFSSQSQSQNNPQGPSGSAL